MNAAETVVDGLTQTQRDMFDREGYVVVDRVFTDADLQPVIDEVQNEVETRARALVAEGKLSRTYSEFGFERQLTMISREVDQLALGIWSGVLCGPAFFNLIRHPRLLDMAESICGPELIASSVYRLRPKIPGHVMGPVPWHQDSGYFEPYCDKAMVLTVWLPLVDATQERGCLWVIPRAHRGPVITHHSRTGKPYLEIVAADLPALQPVCVPVQKGSILLLSNLTPHASFENTTDVVRWSMDLRYQSATLPTNAPITRLPGETVSQPENSVPISCYPPEADFLVRSQKRPSEVLSDPAEFQRIRTQHQSKPVTPRWTVSV
jgi:phytanoyl-CoA hydroxylase